MPQKFSHLHRRTFLLGTGLSLGLPFLESMAVASPAAEAATLPSRIFCAYFPFGIASLDETHENAAWGWWPIGSGRDFRLSNTLVPLEGLRDETTFFQGFQHNQVRAPGHGSADYFLTGANQQVVGNSISVDQVAAAHLGADTRIQSLVLSTEGGVGRTGLTHTLSYTAGGRPIPGLSNPLEIYERLFGGNSASVRQQLERDRSALDLLLESSRSLERQLGQADRRTLDEYLSSVRTLEADVRRSQAWLDAARISVDREELTLNAQAEGGDPCAYLRVMYDLVFHAFRTDATRVATYLTGSMHGASSLANRWPSFMGQGRNSTAHALAHAAQNVPQARCRYDAALLEQFAYLLKRLKETREGDSTLLDRTLLFYGSSNSRTHNNTNYPLILAGGRRLGFQHGQYVKNPNKRPLADIFYTMLQGLGVPARSFADSADAMTEIRS